MKARDVEDFARGLGDQKEAYIQHHVRPALRYLLRKAHRRIPRRQLAFIDGMGAYTFSIENYPNNSEYDFTVAMSTPAHRTESYRTARLRCRFPELVKFCTIVEAVTEYLNMDIGVIRIG